MKRQAGNSERAARGRVPFGSAFVFCSAAFGLALFFVRLFFTVDYYDEFFNTSVAYQAVLGQTFLSDIWNFFQTGDAIQIPFLWLFRTVFGSMDGVIAAGRVFYFLCCCVIGLLAYFTFRQEKNIALFAAVLIACYAPFSLSYWWYDTAMIQFFLLGCLFLMRALDCESASQRRINLVIAGLCHAWMVFSYPFSILLVLFFTVYLSIRKRSVLPALWYLLGALILLGVFCAYCAGIGFENLFFLRQNQSGAVASGAVTGLSGRGYLFDVSGYFSRIGSSVVAVIHAYRAQLIAFILSSVLILAFYWARRWKLCLAVLLSQPLIPFLLSLTANEFSTVFYWAYFFMLGLPCWLLLRSADQTRRVDRMFFVLWLPSLLAFCAITLTALGDATLKGLLGLYCGAFCGFLFFLFLIRFVLSKLSISVSEFLLSLAGLALLACEILLYCVSPYRSERAFRCDYVMQSGVCKGIVTVRADKSYETLEEELNSLLVQDDRTILSLDRAAYIYLMTDLKMATPMPEAWSEEYEYWRQVSGMPDVIVCLTNRLNEKTETMRTILHENYTQIGVAGDFSVYRINASGAVPDTVADAAP